MPSATVSTVASASSATTPASIRSVTCGPTITIPSSSPYLVSWIDLTQPTVSFCITARAFGWVKSIHETRYGELLGIVMVGPHVTDLIEAGTVALDAEATVETVADGMAAHPTLSEAIKEAGLVALGRAIHLPNKRRAPARA